MATQPEIESTGTAYSAASGADTSPEFAAFISYRHRNSRDFAEKLELALKAYAKPIWQAPMAIFRDEKYMVPGEPLDELIRDALTNSGTLIYLASKDAAASEWVADELRIWCVEMRRRDDLVIVQTDGLIAHDPVTKLIDWERTDCPPEVLKDVLEKVPLCIDARGLAERETQTLANAEFRRAVNQISAKIRGIDPIELSGVEVKQHRRNLLLRNGLFSLVAISAVAFAIATVVAVRNQKEAEARTKDALARESELLASTSRTHRQQGRRNQAIESALQALPSDLVEPERPLMAESAGALIEAVNAHHRAHSVGEADQWVRAATMGPEGNLVLYGSDAGDVVLWQRSPEPRELVREKLGEWVISVGFSSDGSRAFAVSQTGLVTLIDVASQNAQTQPTGLRVSVAEMDPTGDRIALGTKDGSVAIWDVRSGRLVRSLKVHDDNVRVVRFAPDGMLMSAADDGTVYVANVETGAELHSLPRFDHWVFDARIDQSGWYLATAAGRLGAIWSVGSDTPAAELPHGDVIEELRFDRTGTRIVTASRDRTARVWQVPDGAPVATLLHPQGVSHAAILPNGDHVVTGSEDGAIRLWSIASGEELILLGRHEALESVSQLDIGPDGTDILSASSGGQVRLWTVPPSFGVHIGHSESVSYVSFHPSGILLLSTSADYSCGVWKVPDGDLVTPIREGDTAQSWCEWGPKGETILFSPFGDGALEVRNPDNGEQIGQSTGHDAPVLSVASTSTGNIAATGDLGGMVRLWPDGYERPSTLLGTLPDAVSYLGFTRADADLIAVSFDGTIAIWSTDEPGDRRDLNWPQRELGRARLNEDGTRLLIATNEGAIHLYETETWTRLSGFDAGDAVLQVMEFSKDGSVAAIAGAEGDVWLWTFEEEPIRLSGHTGWLTDIAIDPVGLRLATSSSDGTVRVWRISDRRPLAVLRGHRGRTTSVDFSPDGQLLASSDEDGGIRVWHLETSIEGLVALAKQLITR